MVVGGGGGGARLTQTENLPLCWPPAELVFPWDLPGSASQPLVRSYRFIGSTSGFTTVGPDMDGWEGGSMSEIWYVVYMGCK